MNNTTLDRELREHFGAGPQLAPAPTIDRALVRAAKMAQRRPRIEWLDRLAWPPRQGSIADPAVGRSARVLATAVLLLLVAAMVAGGVRLLDRPPSITLQHAGALEYRSDLPFGVLWPDGQILVDGRQLFDVQTGETELIRLGDPPIGVGSAHPLPDGGVVLFGVRSSTDPPDNSPGNRVWLYDPATGTVTFAGERPHRFASTELVLRDGRVLQSGGLVRGDDDESYVEEATVDLFDPATGTSQELRPLLEPRYAHEAIELDAGRVLVVGGGAQGRGDIGEIELYDLATQTSKVVGSIDPGPGTYAFGHARLSDGRVLILGGHQIEEPCDVVPMRTDRPASLPSVHAIYHQRTYLFDPASQRLGPGPLLPHAVEQAVPLAGGRALVFGGYLAFPRGCASDQGMYVTPWMGLVDPGRNLVFGSPDLQTGVGELDVSPDIFYDDGVVLPDGRVALLAPLDSTRPNAVDVVTVGP